jgi:uncharacterized protein (TIGR03083 family)
MQHVASFEGAARAFLELLGRIRPEQWERPGLGVWSVRSLAGHTARAITSVDEYLTAPEPASVDWADSESYYLGVAGVVDADAVAARGVTAGEALGDDPAAAVSPVLDRVLAALAAQPEARIVSVVGGRSIPLTGYLPTRTLELVVHTMDLSRATGIPHALPAAAVEAVTGLAGRIAARRGDGERVLLALTGRSPLPEGFSVV